jgi:hypothetical protein
MTNEWSCLAHLSDRELLEEVQTLAARERDATARLIASLMELDSRRPGGRTTVENLSLRCRAHNGHEAELFFGPMMVREARGNWLVTRSGPS